jgi:hypothetical protein
MHVNSSTKTLSGVKDVSLKGLMLSAAKPARASYVARRSGSTRVE